MIENDHELRLALQFAQEKHRGQYRKGGKPYITHPIAVAQDLMERGYDRVYGITALFHDLLEDTNATEEEILEIGGPVVLKAVQRLTKPKNYVMEEYLSGIESNPLAKFVKCADRIDNLRSCHEAPLDFQKKYYHESVRWYREFIAGTPFETAFEAEMAQLEQRISKSLRDGASDQI